MKIELDFAPGLHGHFLELVINKYIYGIEFQLPTVFQSSGAVHVINTDQNYQKNKIVHCGHFSSLGNLTFSKDTDSIIFVQHDSTLDFVLMTNVYYRCHPDAVNTTDFDIERITAMQKALMFNGTDLELRSYWFAKLSERHFEHAESRPKTDLPVYNFDYKSFFHLRDFCQELKNTAKFLEQTFKFDQSLCELWNDFIRRNQGWHLYNLGNALIDATLQGDNQVIANDWKLHAFINFKLSKLFDLYDGQLFDQEVYPSSTDELRSIVTAHVENFDSRW